MAHKRKKKTSLTINDIIPPELLGRVFEMASALERDNDFEEFSTRVCRVCKLWHSIAVSTPGLWNLILVNDTTPLAKIETWLKRSGSVGLQVVIAVSEQVNLEKLAAISDKLADHAKRLQTFECQVSTEGSMRAITSFMQDHSFPALEKLGLNDETNDFLEEDATDGEDQPLLDLFTDITSVPQLVEISLWSTPVPLRALPFANLTKLELSYLPINVRVTLTHLQEFLGHAIHLEEMSLCGDLVTLTEADLPTTPNDPFPSTITLPRLQRLEFSDLEQPSSLIRVLHMLRMPNLRRLSFCDLRDTSDGELLDFSEVLSTIATVAVSSGLSGGLESLRLANVRFCSPSAWNALLRSLPRLHELHIVHLDDDTVSENPQDLAVKYFGRLYSQIPEAEQRMHGALLLRSSLSSPVVCPQLRELTTFGFDSEVLHMIANDRKSAGVPLQRIIASTHDALSMINIESLKALGIEVEEYEDSDYGSGSEIDSEADGTGSEEDAP